MSMHHINKLAGTVDGSPEHLIMQINLPVVWTDEEERTCRDIYPGTTIQMPVFLEPSCSNACLPWTSFSPPAIIKMDTPLTDRVANWEGGRIPQDIVLETLLQIAKNPQNTYLCIFFIAWNAVSRFTFCQTKQEQKWNSCYSTYTIKIQLRRPDPLPMSGSKQSNQPTRKQQRSMDPLLQQQQSKG